MRVEIDRRPDAVDRLWDEWTALLDADPKATPFSSPAWARPWMRHFAEGQTPWLAVAREEGRMVALAPLIIRRRGPVRMLRPLGQEPGDYWDVIALPEHRAEATRALAAACSERAREWDLMAIDCLRPGSGTEAELMTAGLRVRRRFETRCPGLELPSSFDAYLSTLTRKHRTRIKRHLRRLDEGELELREPSAGEVSDGVRRWHELRLRQWESASVDVYPLHREERFRDFIGEVLVELLPRGHAHLWEFHHDGELVASYVHFADERCFYYYLGGFDRAFAKLGLGNLNACLGIRSSIERGRSYFDFLAGDEAYKYWFGATERRAPSLLAASSRVGSRLALLASRARDAIR